MQNEYGTGHFSWRCARTLMLLALCAAMSCTSKSNTTSSAGAVTGGAPSFAGVNGSTGGSGAPSGGAAGTMIASTGGAFPTGSSGGAVTAGGSAGASGAGGGTASNGGSVASGGSGGAGNSSGGTAGSGGSAGADAGPPGKPATPADYAATGPYGATKKLLNQGKGTVSGGSQALLPLGNSNDPSAFTLFYPAGGSATERLPLLTWGNGTFCSPTFYDALIDHVVSYGFIVVATNTSNVGTGVEMLEAVDWALAQDQDASSPIHDRVDREHIGAFGHSQGGAGTVMTGADPRIKAIAPLSGAPLSDRQDASVGIQCPTFYVTTEGDIATPDSIEQVYQYTIPPTAFGVTSGGNHDEYTDIADDPHIPD
jgi:hypothetical protein